MLARRGFVSVRTPWLTAEWGDVVERVARERQWKNPNWINWLTWLRHASRLLDDPPIRATVREDPKDDPVIAAAAGGQAQCLVSYDRHLLGLGKPYGVMCVTPRAFLAALGKT